MRQKIKPIIEVLSDKDGVRIIRETTPKKNQVKCPHCNHLFLAGCGFEIVMAHMASEHPAIFWRVMERHSIQRKTKVTDGISKENES